MLDSCRVDSIHAGSCVVFSGWHGFDIFGGFVPLWGWQYWWIMSAATPTLAVLGMGGGGGMISGVVGGGEVSGSSQSNVLSTSTSRSTQSWRRAEKPKSGLALTTGAVVPSHGEKWAPDLVYQRISPQSTCRKRVRTFLNAKKLVRMPRIVT